MNLEKLAKSLKKELLRSPKKAAILGVASLAAIYFWVPLIWKWSTPEGGRSSGKKAPLVQNSEAGLAGEANPTVAGTHSLEGSATVGDTGRGSRSSTWSWETMVKALSGDARLQSAPLPARLHDRFSAAPAPELEDDVQRAVEEEAKTAEKTPQQPSAEPARTPTPKELNLVLQSAIVGARRKMATISGVNYLQGSRIVFDSADRPGAAVSFLVARIEPDRVVLRSGGDEFILELSPPQLTGTDRIVAD